MADVTLRPSTGPLPVARVNPAAGGGNPNPAAGANPGATTAGNGLLGDANRVNLPGGGGLNLPGLGNLTDAIGDISNAAARIFTGASDLQSGVDATQGYVDLVSGAGDTAAGLRGANVGTQGIASRLVEGLSDAMDESTRLGKGLIVGGGSLGAVGGGAQILGAVNTLSEGKVAEGSFDLVGGMARVGEGVGMVAGALRPAGAIATTLGTRGVPILGAVAGAAQIGSALSQDPADMTSAATGLMTTVGSAAMLFPPVGTAVGGAMVATAAIIDNWDTITAVGGAAAEGVGKAADAVGGAISGAASKVANFFGW